MLLHCKSKTWMFFIVALAGATLVCGGALRAGEVAPVLLRYGFKPGQTNAYRLVIESQGEAGREAVAGNFTVAVGSVGSNRFELTLQGHLQMTNTPGMAPAMGFYRGPGSVSTLTSYTWTSPMTGDGKSLIIDDRGKVLRETGDQALPIPLGQLMNSLLEKFPEEPVSQWSEDRDVFVLDEPVFQGPADSFLPSSRFQPTFFYPGRQGHGPQGVLTARQKTKAQVTEVTPDTVRFEKTVNLDSYLLTGTDPRITATGQCKTVFDRSNGCPRSVEWNCTMVAVTEDLSRRSVLTLRWEMLEGAERAAALIPPPPVSAEKPALAAARVASLMEQVHSDELGKRQSALIELSNGRLTNAGPEILHEMASLADDSDEMIRRGALTILANYGGPDEIPVLIKELGEAPQGVGTLILRALGRLKDPRTAAPLAEFLASGQNDQQFYQPDHVNEVAEALIKIGPASETPTLAVLKEKNVQTRIQACLVLKQIGTKKSLHPLKELALSPDKALSDAATSASHSIENREEK